MSQGDFAERGENWDRWLETYASELVNYNGRSVVPDLVAWRGVLWFTDPRVTWQELLVPRLGKKWLNVAESVPGPDVKDAITIDGVARGPFSRPLVRIVQTYASEELPAQDNDAAIARELAFCLWVRRRDPSPWNRAYVGGLPAFFDQHVAFEFCPLDSFFAQGPDGGYPSQWRVRTLPSGDVPTTMSERGAIDIASGITLHRVADVSAFDRELDAAVQLIQTFDEGWLAEQVAVTGAPAEAGERLVETQHELPEAARRIRAFLYA